MIKLYVKNFGGIKEAEIEVKPLTIFIGKQASGKSILSKLIYFFNECFNILIYNYHDNSQEEILAIIKERFNEYFSITNLTDEVFVIQYTAGENKIYLSNSSKLHIKFNIELIDRFETIKQKANDEIKRSEENLSSAIERSGYNHTIEIKRLDMMLSEMLRDINIASTSYFGRSKYITAGRTLFLLLQNNIFKFLQGNNTLDKFIQSFGVDYQMSYDRNVNFDTVVPFSITNYEKVNGYTIQDRLNMYNQTFFEVVGARLVPEIRPYLLHDDGRKVFIENSSAGQQEIMPLLQVLKFVYIYAQSNNLIVIEEPEAHLFPKAQNDVVNFISLIGNTIKDSCIIITTHSPYILSSFNNNIYANIKSKEHNNAESVNTIIPKDYHVDPETVAVYELRDGHAYSIIDHETRLINAEYLDGISEDIGKKFESLLYL
jgi:hypothetical protein